ncbi:MAG: amylo-alpha-1,6-glucosidase, partial [Hadesarchaea archaeon]|nr:amylo-alpha-1,6-glucosidase [Hadesarchaea archaeon]
MRSRLFFMSLLILSITIVVLDGSIGAAHASNPNQPDEISIRGQASDWLAYTFTNKRTSYLWLSTTGEPMSEFSGFNARKLRVLESWNTVVDGMTVTPSSGEFTYHPSKFSRTTGGVTEIVFMPDGEDGFIIKYVCKSVPFSLSFTPFLDIAYGDAWDLDNNVLTFQSFAAGRASVAHVSITSNHQLTYDGSQRGRVNHRYRFDEYRVENTRTIYGPVLRGGELRASNINTPIKLAIGVGSTRAEATSTAQRILSQFEDMLENKTDRIMGLIDSCEIGTSSADFTKALKLALASADSLMVEEPYGKMIWAGLPWFNQPWGRDTFISLSGFALVTGRFEEAKEILQKFSRFQREKDGRIPNWIDTSPDYNTTDGTPWFIKRCYEYYLYTGDESFVTNMFPVIERAIDGTWSTYGDPSDGFITHAGLETWMDTPRDPREGKAVEIQALWINELLDGARMAEIAGKTSTAARWRQMAKTAAESFRSVFWNEALSFLYDYISAAGSKIDRIRPNAFVGLAAASDADLISSEKMGRMIQTALSRGLIAPHGVRSLIPADPLYVGIDSSTWDPPAYHNGDVWPWLSGPVIQFFVDAGYVDEASKLMEVYLDHLLNRGNVGSITEIMDGDRNTPKGCWTQAWSVAEFLRVYYQVFLGINPTPDHVEISPHPITNLNHISAASKIRGRMITENYSIGENYQRLTLTTDSATDFVIRFSIPKIFSSVSMEVDGERSTAQVDENGEVEISLEVVGKTTVKVEYGEAISAGEAVSA